jgi:aryl-alcohol dehydrogenase-like predicted oxidoreductase
VKYHLLGQTGLFVSEMCLGTMTFGINPGRYAAAGGLLQADADAIVKRAFDAGINFIDTANVYGGMGGSEEITGQALKNLGIARKDVVICTKVEGTMGNGPNDGGASRYHIMDQVKGSLRRLGTDHIDLYMLHGFDPATPIEEMVRALDDLVRQGHVRYVGVSNWAAWQIAEALGISERLNAARFQSVQSYYSLVGRDTEREIVPMLAAKHLGLMVWSPLAGGHLSGKYRDGAEGRRSTVAFPPIDEGRGSAILPVLERIAAAHGTTMATIAVAWLLHQPVVTSVILGVKHVAQLEENLRATEISLSEDELTALDAVSALAPEYPGWMVHIHGVPRRQLLQTARLPVAD